MLLLVFPPCNAKMRRDIHSHIQTNMHKRKIQVFKIVQDSSQNTTNKVVEYLLLRQHVSALALGHHQVSNFASEKTRLCSISNEISLIA